MSFHFYEVLLHLLFSIGRNCEDMNSPFEGIYQTLTSDGQAGGAPIQSILEFLIYRS